MTLDPGKIQALVDLVKIDFPSWTGFSDERFVKNERAYKLATRDKAVGQDGLLAKERLSQLVEDRAFETFIGSLETIGRDTNLLYNNQPLYGDMNILYEDKLDKEAFCRAVLDLLWGEDDVGIRLDRYQAFVAAAELPQKWAFATYFLFICHDGEMFVKPEATAWFLKQLDADPGIIGSRPSAELYASIKEAMAEAGEALKSLGYPPADTIDLQSFLWSTFYTNRTQEKGPIKADARSEFLGLFEKFVPDYLNTPTGVEHRQLYAEVRATGRANFEAMVAAQDRGEDVTDAVLRQLLPHNDTQTHRDGGYWVHVAPAINGDIRSWFEAAGVQTAENWPEVAKAILRFVRACDADPKNLKAACQEFSATPYSKGFQQGMLSPILNALRPADFVLVNNKSRSVLNYFGHQKFGQELTQYPDVNDFERKMVDALAGDMSDRAGETDMLSSDLFDQFCHYLAAIRKYPLAARQYWKVAPGESATLWAAWCDGSYISVGWDEFGDLTGLKTPQFEKLQKELMSEYPYLTKTGTNQLWTFALRIKPGDRIVANRGMSEVLGIGTVTGSYYYVDGQEYRHRIPVEWDDTGVRTVSKQAGWERTIVGLKEEAFDAICAIEPKKPERLPLATPFDRVFPDRETAEWWFDFTRHMLEGVGVMDPADERIAITLPWSTGETTIHVNFQTWLIGGYGPASSDSPVVLTTLAGPIAKDEMGYWDEYTPKEGEPIVELRSVPAKIAQDDARVLDAYRASLPVIDGRFPTARRSLHRRHHRDALCQAVFDTNARRRLLDEGLEAIENPLSPNAAFNKRAFTLLGELAKTPTQAFYGENRASFQADVEMPVQRLMQAVAERLPDQVIAAMETQKRIYGRIPKNDYGRGGAWTFYWGAFYPKGGKRVEGSQLFVFLDENGLNYGFSVGDYGSLERKRLERNAAQNRPALAKVLGDSLSDLGLTFGGRNRESAGADDDERSSVSLDQWLRSVGEAGVGVDILLTPTEVLQLPETEVVSRVTDAFTALFPIVLLATDDDPMPAIAAYHGYEEAVDLAEVYSFDQLVTDTYMDPDQLRRWLNAIERKKQAILYGPPGTGKTFVAERLARHVISGKDGMWDLVQFHPAYAYEDFMQGIRPRPGADNQLEYPIVPGRFLEFCMRAKAHKDTCVLIIDEINRANLARVFGELMYLLEYRDRDIALAGGDRRFQIPDNVRVLGTMNTADRSIALVDHALRRRFAFLALYPDYAVLRRFHEQTPYDPTKLITLLEGLNRKIDDDHYSVGISFFLNAELSQHLPDIWRMEIEPYLEEYFFDQDGVVEAYRWAEVEKQLT